MFVVGTAGHVDHGKSTLVHALTGMDPDRLAEEKARGMTIDLGFAWLPLDDGREVSIVDVPGHERFVKNMLAGVGGIDVALLVIAADEGVMPQTREHLAIVDLLGIPRGLVALTKCDLVEDDWLELVADEVRQELAGTILADAALVPISATTGEGLAELKTHLAALLDEARPRPASGLPRLPIDRVFTLSGHGTVVTGTLIDGTLRAGDEVEILPSGLRTRVRSLQTHRQRVTEATAGSRVAANLVGLTVEQLQRGDVLCGPSWLHPTTAVDVSLRLLPSADKPLRAADEVLLYIGAAEVPATVRPLDGPALEPGQHGPVHLRLAHPAVVQRGDRFIIRRPSPAETIGGGEVLDPHARRGRRGRGGFVLEGELEGPDLLAEVLRTRRLWAIGDLAARIQQPAERTAEELRVLEMDGRAIVLRGVAMGTTEWRGLAAAVRDILAAYHAVQPLRAGMPREELRERLGVAPALWPVVADRLLLAGVMAEHSALAHLPDFRPRLSAQQEQRTLTIMAAVAAGGFSPPSLGDVTDESDAPLLAHLIEQGALVRLNEQLAYPSDTYRAIVARIVAAFDAGPVTVASVRDLLGVSRRYALALLEHLDMQRVTRRSGDERTLLRRPDWLAITPASS